MKIQNDHLRVLLEQSEARRKPKALKEGFETLLSEQLEQSQSGNKADFLQSAGQNSAALAMQIRAVQELGGTANGDDAENDSGFAFDRVNSLLDKWDVYAGSMGRPDTANLKNMYGLLSGMSDELSAIKANVPNLGGNPDLAGLVNELEVLTTTERIKFDRGDYL